MFVARTEREYFQSFSGLSKAKVLAWGSLPAQGLIGLEGYARTLEGVGKVKWGTNLEGRPVLLMYYDPSVWTEGDLESVLQDWIDMERA